ncbi:MAG: 50S ribosomal protein L13 [Candidatus Hepatoplasma scabrum]|nr:MAG: 50S ribosomal protein L13 [Candidatus Hepatoplasma sp.]
MRQTKMAFNDQIEKKWYLIDAKDLILGRMASEVAKIITGKNKTSYTPHEDHGDYVILINANKITLTGNKLEQKMYYNHSGYPGGLRKRNASEMLEKYPQEMIYRAVWGMIPHNKLGRKQIKKLFIYLDENHNHQAQKPEEIKLKRNN